ncbi:MAG: hypothetical protein AAF597_09750 [Bacteroidota bacterium]
MEIHLKIIGWLLMTLALVHAIFPRYFNWAEDLAPLSLMNRQMMKTHTFFIALMVFMIGLLCATASVELTSTKLGQHVCLGLTVFWGLRLFFQLFVYSPKLWRGKAFETTVHVVFTGFWLYMAVVFGCIGLS